MEAQSFDTPQFKNDLLTFLSETYASQKNFDFFLSEAKKSIEFCIGNPHVSFESFAVTKKGRALALGALIIDTRLPKEQAFFGFLEFPENERLFRMLWGSLLERARRKGVRILKGPVHGSIWHQYRCVKETDGSTPFLSEVVSQAHYYPFFLSQQPSAEIAYYSAYRQPFDIVLRVLGGEAISKAERAGFSIDVVQSVTREQLLTIAEISKSVFRESWGYTELTDREFLALYSADKITTHLQSLYVLHKNNTMIGFCSTLRGDTDTLICKTICILPKYRGLGLGNALAYKVHEDAKRNGFTKIIYALIREGNSISQFPNDGAVIFRKYAAFDYTL